MGRPTDWWVLGLDSDPTPGDPSRVIDLAGRLHGFANDVETAHRNVVSLGNDSAVMEWIGQSGDAYRATYGDTPGDLVKLFTSYRMAGDALTTFGPKLEAAQSQADSALAQGRAARSRLNSANANLSTTQSWVQRANQQVQQYQNQPKSAPAPDPSTVQAASRNAAAAQAQLTSDQGAASSAQSDLDAATRLAQQAFQMREAAARDAASTINSASDAGIKNKPWYEQAFDWVVNHWDQIVTVLKVVVAVLGVIVLIIGGPLAWVLVGLSAVLLVDATVRAVQGKGSWWDVAFALLGCIPMTDGFTSLSELSSLWREGGLLKVAGTLGPRLVDNVTNLVSTFKNSASAGVTFVKGLPDALSGLVQLRQVASADGAGSFLSLASDSSGLKSLWSDTVDAFHGVSGDSPQGVQDLTTCGDPIDVVSGQMVMPQTDVTLPGVLALVLGRTYLSSYRRGRWFGSSWVSTLDQRLEIDGSRILFVAEGGRVLSYPAPEAGQPVMPTVGPRWPLTREAAGRYAVTDPQAGVTWHFTGPGHGEADGDLLPLTALTARQGDRIDVRYDADGVPVDVRHSGGYRVGVETTAMGGGYRITGLSLLAGPAETPDGGFEPPVCEPVVLVRFGYDKLGRLTEVHNSSGAPLRFEYNVRGQLVRWIDRNGLWYRYHYHLSGRVLSAEGTGDVLRTALSYDEANQVTTVTDSLGHRTRYEWDAAGHVTAITDPLGHRTTQEWDRYGRLLARTDPLGRTTRYAYDRDGNLTAVARPDMTQVTAVYGDVDQPVEIQEADGTTWRQEFDDRGNLIATTDPAGAVTRYTYDETGHLASVTDALDQVRRVETNAAGLVGRVTDPAGGTIRYVRDAFGRVIAVIDQAGGTTRMGWTPEGRLAWRTLPDGAREEWRYDGEDNLLEHRNAAGGVTSFEIAVFDLPVARTEPDGTRLEFAYDTELRLTAVTNPQGLTWTYEYDPAGQLVRETDFNGRALTYTYDDAGQLVSRTNGAGQTVRFARDPLGRVTERRSGEEVTTFGHDDAGRLRRAANADVELSYTYDPCGRILTETCNGRVLTNTYDLVGRRIGRRTPGGAASVWTYDANDQPVTLNTADQTLAFVYDSAGREIERALGADVRLNQAWDSAGRLTAQTLTAAPPSVGLNAPAAAAPARLLHRDYRYRPDGYLTGIDDEVFGRRRFDLDPAGRVTAVHSHGWTERYAYDPAGNLTHAAWPTPVVTDPTPETGDTRGEHAYTGTLLHRAGRTHYEHDAQGRVVRQTRRLLSGTARTWIYTWDADDRLSAVATPDGHHWAYTYDPHGRRIAKTHHAADGTMLDRTDFTWDGTQLAEETRVSHGGARSGDRAAETHTITWDWHPYTAQPLTQTDRSSLRDAPRDEIDQRFHAIIADLVGTPTELVTANGHVAWHARTTLWGSALTSSSPGEINCPLRFPGQYHDDETGLNYNYHRYYNPDTGRYHTLDPLGLEPAPNPNTYVHNPLAEIDPLGLAACTSISSRMREAGPGNEFGLPSEGRIRYVPPRDYNPANPLPRGPQNGYIDRFGNEWVPGPSRTPGEPFEWDVQLSRTGKSQLGWLSRDGAHVNVSLRGRVTHK